MEKRYVRFVNLWTVLVVQIRKELDGNSVLQSPLLKHKEKVEDTKLVFLHRTLWFALTASSRKIRLELFFPLNQEKSFSQKQRTVWYDLISLFSYSVILCSAHFLTANLCNYALTYVSPSVIRETLSKEAKLTLISSYVCIFFFGKNINAPALVRRNYYTELKRLQRKSSL